MELRDLEYFAIVAEHGHLGRAADALGLSQPALSKCMARLERALQVKLAKRTPKGLEVTAEGVALLERIRELRRNLQSVAREIKGVREGLVGHLRIGTGFAVSQRILSDAFTRLLSDAPRTKLDVRIADNDVLIPMLHNGEIDLVLNYRQPTEGLVHEPLYDDEFVVVASSAHPLARKTHVKLSDLAEERWAFAEPTLFSHRWLPDKFRDAGLPPPLVAVESRSTALRIQIVASSRLLAFVSRSAIRESSARHEVKVLPIAGIAWPFPVAIMHRKGDLTPALARFVDVLRLVRSELDGNPKPKIAHDHRSKAIGTRSYRT